MSINNTNLRQILEKGRKDVITLILARKPDWLPNDAHLLYAPTRAMKTAMLQG